MKITLNNQKTNSNINYKAGKVKVFSDFDRTFFPASQREMVTPKNAEFVINLRNYFSKLKQFLENTKNGITFSITSGRTLGEVQKVYEISRTKGYGMPMPDTIIAKNGSDEYLKAGTEEDFYNWKDFPFNYETTNKEKEEKIKKISGWDGNVIKQKLKDIYASYGMRIVEADSDYGPVEFGDKSLFSRGKLKNESDLLFEYYEADCLADWAVGFRNDGKCKIYVTEPLDMHLVDERFNILREINKKIFNMFQELNVKFKTSEYSRGGEVLKCGGRPYHTYEPRADFENLNDIDYGLSKLYDVKEAVKEAQKNNNFVIAAGDGENDCTMLNPFYLLTDEIKNLDTDENEKNKILNSIPSPEKMIEYMKKYPQLFKAFRNLPFIGIIVKSKFNDLGIAELAKYYGDGKYKKLIIINEGDLQDGIKNAIRMYCKNNPEFNGKLSPDIRQEVMKHKKSLRDN